MPFEPVERSAPSITERVIVALDVPTGLEALSLVKALSGPLAMVKVGPHLFMAEGPAMIGTLQDQGVGVFLDLKFHDIPAVVGAAVARACALGVRLLTVHTSGGPAMLEAAAEAAQKAARASDRPPTQILGVTVLTSLEADALAAVGDTRPLLELVERRARLAQKCGLDGVVCSPREIGLVRSACGDDFVVLCPGVRDPAHPVDADDQARTASPQQAMAEGADYLVVGRPIRQATDPCATLIRFQAAALEGLESRRLQAGRGR